MHFWVFQGLGPIKKPKLFCRCKEKIGGNCMYNTVILLNSGWSNGIWAVESGFWKKRKTYLTNNRRTSSQPIWLTKDGSKPNSDWWQTLHESFSQYHHGFTDQSLSTDQTYNIIDWQTLFTWFWRWLPLSSLHNYPHPDDQKIRTTDTPEFKPFTL